ncbi:MAG: divergent polysaccharide deacetylase family protein [Candidatus Binatia bacterium]
MALRGERPPIGLAWVVTWPLSAVLAAAAFLCTAELHHSLHSTEPPAPTERSGEWNARLPARIAAVDVALRKGPLHLAAPIEEDRGAGPLRFKHRLYEVQLTRADQERAEATIEAVRGADPGLVLRTAQNPDDTEVRIGLDGLEVTTVRFLWRENPRARPRVAVVVGPFGADLRLARQVIEMIDAPIVLGVDPRAPFAAQVAELGAIYDRETVLQFFAPPPPPPTPTPSDDPLAPTAVPRPKGPPPPDLEAGLTAVPKAVAVAWIGPGPALPRADRGLLAASDERHLPFVGERGDKRPAALPLPIALVEDEKRPEALAEQLQKIAESARRLGRAVVVAAPSDATIDALQAMLPQWHAGDVEVVPLSAVVEAVAVTPAPTVTPTAKVARR